MFESSKPESPDERMENEFRKFIKDKNFSAEEIRQSYFDLCGISDQDSTERTKELTEKMEEMSQDHFPINRFVKFVEDAELLEGAVNEFQKYVSDLDISDNEKRVLNSIVEKRRNGILECHVDDEPKGKIEIKGNVNSNETALILLYGLSKILSSISIDDVLSKSKEVSFWFEEE